MRRKAKYEPIWHPHRVITDVDPERLRLIGAIALDWNFLEDTVDECLHVSVHWPYELRVEIASRINGLEGKFEILKAAVDVYRILEPAEKVLIKDTIGAISVLKTFRDAVIHMRLADPKSDIGLTHPKKGGAYEILTSIPALRSLHTHIETVAEEAIFVYRILEPYYFDEWDLAPEGPFDPKEIRAKKEFREVISQTPGTSEPSAVSRASSTTSGGTLKSSNAGRAIKTGLVFSRSPFPSERAIAEARSARKGAEGHSSGPEVTAPTLRASLRASWGFGRISSITTPAIDPKLHP